MSNVDVLNNAGFENSDAIVNASNSTGLPIWIAAALVQKESMGQNIFGHDAGGVYSGAGEVTEEKFNYLVGRVAAGAVSNGVGLTQITYGGYFPQAASQGLKLWVPYDNCVFGFNILLRYLNGDYSDYSIQRAGTLFNAGSLSNGITAYGYDLQQKADYWKNVFNGITVKHSIEEWASQAVGKWMDDNESGLADCTDVPKDMHEYCTGTTWESANLYGNGQDLAGNCSSDWYTVESFSTDKAYPKGTIFSAYVSGSKYGHTGVLSHVVNGIWQAFQQDTDLNTSCQLRELQFTPHTVAIPLYADTAVSAPAQTQTQSTVDPSTFTIWTVDPGDTLSSIAATVGTTYQELARINGISNPDWLQVGQVLKLKDNASAPQTVDQTTYTVQSGDTLSAIGSRFGVDYNVIAQANGLYNPDQIFAGQTLVIPSTSVNSVSQQSSQRTYTVQVGDTLGGIGLQCGVDFNAIAEVNGLSDPNLIYPGQVLIIP